MRYFLSVAAFLICCQAATGGGPCSGVRGGCGRSSYRTSVSIPSYDDSPASGTVNVRSYTRKDGTHVRAHTRSAPGGGPKPSYRTSARTSARTGYWNGTGSAPDADDPSLYAPAPAKIPEAVEPVVEPPTDSLPERYVVYFKSGRLKYVADYLEEVNDYLLIGTERSRGRFPKKMVDRIERMAKVPDLQIKGRPNRKWADKGGTHHAEARYTGLEDGKVRLLKSEGRTSLVVFGNLSAADQSYVLAAIEEDEGK